MEWSIDKVGETTKKLGKNKVFLVAAAGVGVLALVLARRRGSKEAAVAIESYPTLPQDNSGPVGGAPIGGGASGGWDQQTDMSQARPTSVDTEAIQTRIDAMQTQLIQQQAAQIQSNTDWHVTTDGSFQYGETGTNFTPTANTVNELPTRTTSSGKKTTDLGADSPSGIYTYTPGGGGTFTAGKVKTEPVDSSKQTVTQNKDGYSVGGKSYSKLTDALHAAGAKGY